MIIYIVRHPETEFNQKGIIQGHADSPLTKKGRQTAEKLGCLLKDKGIARIYSSDFGRCMQTSRIISKQLKVKIIPKPELRELNYGHFNGKPAEAIRNNFDLEDPYLIFPGGERFSQMKKRVLKLIKTIKEKGPLLIVAHEGCLRAILSEIYHLQFTSAGCNSSPNKIFILNSENRKISKLSLT